MHTHNAPGAPAAQHGQTGPAASVTENAAQVKEAAAQAGDGPGACAADAEGAAGAMLEEKRAPGAQAAGGRDAPCPAGAAPMPAEGAQAHGAPGCGRAKLWPLFLATLYISTFTFGGGFVIVTFMKRKFVDSLKWLSEE